MLASQWDALDGAIPRLQADEQYSHYLVAVAASPHAGKEGQKLANSWREIAYKGFSEMVSTTRVGVQRALGRTNEMSLAAVFDHLRSVFGPTIRD